MLLAALPALAVYPEKPIKLVVAFPPGGGNDQIGRLLAERLSHVMSAQFVVENYGGAGGNVGTAMVAKASPDGYTLLVASNQVVINPFLYKKIPFDVVKDLTPISIVADVQFVVVATPKSNIKTISELVTTDRKSPGKLYHGTPGNGTPQHLAAELFNTRAKTTLSHVPYKGTGPAMADLLGNQIQIAFATLPVAVPYIKSDKLTALAVTGKTRSPLLPNVPTVEETGVKNYVANTWYGIMAPAGLKTDIQQSLAKAIQLALAEPEFKQKLIDLGFEPRFTNGAAMATEMRQDMAGWEQVVKGTNVKLD